MTDPDDPPFASHEEYLQVVARLHAEAAGDSRWLEVLALMERAIRYEMDRGLPGPERLASRLAGRAGPQAKRTALISDIHGNFEGLAVVLEDIERLACDRILCLGDLVDGGPGDEEVVALLRERRIRAVRGNHDEHNDAPLQRGTREFLARLPEAIVEDDVHYTHISPRRRKRKVNHAVEAWNVFEDCDFRLLFVGHAHVPLHFARSSESYGEARSLPVEYNRPVSLERDERYIVCVGSVGYGRDDVGKLRYAIFDRDAWSIEFRALDGPLLPCDHTLRRRFDGPLELQPREEGAG
jgi:predicted phosphodiesterase